MVRMPIKCGRSKTDMSELHRRRTNMSLASQYGCGQSVNKSSQSRYSNTEMSDRHWRQTKMSLASQDDWRNGVPPVNISAPRHERVMKRRLLTMTADWPSQCCSMMQQEQRFLTLLMLQNPLPHKQCGEEVYRQMASSTLFLLRYTPNGEHTRRARQLNNDGRGPTTARGVVKTDCPPQSRSTIWASETGAEISLHC